ncbi:MAG: DUF2624 family protein [Clostridia bacterium]|nr:DUF2624 family protein [Clostridia bacterium]NLS84816.1 hypothetical protein [Oscillospiraceae bacterium]
MSEQEIPIEMFNKALVEKVQKCETAAQLIAVAKEHNIPLTEEQAEIQLEHLKKKFG